MWPPSALWPMFVRDEAVLLGVRCSGDGVHSWDGDQKTFGDTNVIVVMTRCSKCNLIQAEPIYV